MATSGFSQSMVFMVSRTSRVLTCEMSILCFLNKLSIIPLYKSAAKIQKIIGLTKFYFI